MSKYKFLVIMIVFVIFIATTGCSTTTSVQSQLNTPAGPLQAQGDLTVVERTTTTSTERTFQSAKNREAAQLELLLAKEKTKQVRAKARAANPCSTWFMSPSYCYGYSSGVVVNRREGGRNYIYRGN